MALISLISHTKTKPSSIPIFVAVSCTGEFQWLLMSFITLSWSPSVGSTLVQLSLMLATLGDVQCPPIYIVQCWKAEQKLWWQRSMNGIEMGMRRTPDRVWLVELVLLYIILSRNYKQELKFQNFEFGSLIYCDMNIN